MYHKACVFVKLWHGQQFTDNPHMISSILYTTQHYKYQWNVRFLCHLRKLQVLQFTSKVQYKDKANSKTICECTWKHEGQTVTQYYDVLWWVLEFDQEYLSFFYLRTGKRAKWKRQKLNVIRKAVGQNIVSSSVIMRYDYQESGANYWYFI